MVNKVAQRAIAAGLAGMMSFGAVAPAAMALDTHNWSSWWNWSDTSSDEGLTYWRRIAGDDRYGTMKKIVEASYKIGGDNWWMANVAVVASGDNFPDALAANGLAGALNGGDGAPVILTKKGALSSQAKELLQKMSVQTVYIMGGTAAVSEATENAIKDLKIATVRVAGADRQATSVAAFKLIDGNWYKNRGTHSVIIATGANFADALSIAPFAYRTGTPVVLTKSDGTLTDEAVKAIKDNDQIYQVIVLGGTEAVSDSVFSVLGTYNGSYRDYYNKLYIPIRIAGADRYDTSAKIADWEINYAYDIKGEYNSKTNYWNYAGFSFDEVFVARGDDFPDALAGGQLAGGKYYANQTYTVNNIRWKGTDYGINTSLIKDASPILLTKDGNRAADSVIASNLAWNGSKVSVDAYELMDGTVVGPLKALTTTQTNYWDANAMGEISPDIYNYDAEGFFTDVAVTSSNVNATTNYLKVTEDAKGVSKIEWTPTTPSTATNNSAVKVHWIDGWRLVGNNFNGVILGGKNAVSKDKAKQLDDTVRDSILKVKDPTSVYDADSVVTINGVQYRTLAWWSNPKNVRNIITTIGVESTDFNWSNYYKNYSLTNPDATVVVPKGAYNYRYLYQPTGAPQILKYADGTTSEKYDSTTGKLTEATYTWEFARFDRDKIGVADNYYTGYSMDGVFRLVVTYKWDTNGNRYEYAEWQTREYGVWTPVV